MSAGRAIAHLERVRWVPILVVAMLALACSSSPVVTGSPWTIVSSKPAPAKKIDLLLAIDDSPGMADKQKILANALPSLLQRFAGMDLHMAIITSSLGGGGSPDVCAQQDGRAHGVVGDVSGVGESGCGLEAQLESWYRFLIQPDPYDHIALSSNSTPSASLQGVDSTLLQMRKDFLRPDSIVIVLQLTDEEDSWSDPLWFGGYGWTSRAANFPGGPGGGAGPRGTTECDAPEDINNPTTWGPNNPDCTSCAFPGLNKPVSGTPIAQDPNCLQKGWFDPPTSSSPVEAIDGLNVRYGSQYMRRRYGFDNQHDVQRYIDGLSSSIVPDRDNEAHAPNAYSTTKRNCTNPLFAQDLPDGNDTSPAALCQLKSGPRTPDMVFYALVGGVSRSLVKPTLSPDDWTKIVGKDPAHYIFDGIDVHMIESIAPRAGLETAGTSYSLGTDAENGRDWNTQTSQAGIDLEYACTFDLPQPKDCTANANAAGCDCFDTTSSDSAPLCDPQSRTTQVRGKAYPSIRELRVAKGLGKQATVASICTTDDVPAMNALADAVGPLTKAQCFPSIDPAACVMLVVFPGGDQASACNGPGLSQPTSSMLATLAKSGDAACVLAKDCNATTPSWCVTPNPTCSPMNVIAQPANTQLVLMCTATKLN